MSRPDGAELTRVESFQWPSGHVAHLTPNQTNSLDKFKTICQDKGYYLPGSADGTKPPTHDDETLLRYLRARKFIPQEAFNQFKDTEDWRKETQLEKLYETIDIEEYDQTRQLYPQWTGRRDKRGIPLYVFEVQHVEAKAVAAQEKGSRDSSASQISVTTKTPRKMLRLFALYENLCRFVLPLCSAIPDRQHQETPVSQSNNIVDISKVGFAKFWSLRTHMSAASTLATAHYPETLDRIFVVGAPSFFPTVWEWAKKWFDPITVSKIFILNEKNMKETLSKFVDLENVPKKYGGTLDWQFGDMPHLDPVIVSSLRWDVQVKDRGHLSLPKGPIKWQYDSKGDLVMTAIGSDSGKHRQQKIAGLHPKAGVARLSLVPGKANSFYNPIGAVASVALERTVSPAIAKGGAPAMQAMSEEHHVLDAEHLHPDDAAYASANNSYTVPYRDSTAGAAPPTSNIRQGTSETRMEQQSGTHAEGTLAEGSPQGTRDGQGTATSVVETSTVGQAVKEHHIPGQNEEPAPPGYLDQAQWLAAQATERAKVIAAQATEQARLLEEKALAAVGYGHGGVADLKKEEEEPPQQGISRASTESDAAIDKMDPKLVEEFLRHQNMSARKAAEGKR